MKQTKWIVLGALALAGCREHRSTRESEQTILSENGMAAAVRAADPTSSESLQRHVEFLTALDPPRSAAHPDSLDRAAAYIAVELKGAGGRVVDQPFGVEDTTFRNVRAFFGPETGPRLVVGAHYDVCEDLPGADDNGSGTAVLLALAHLLGDADLDQCVELVAFSLEEPPHFASYDMGSARHAELLVEEGTEVLGMLCLEMLGYFSDESGSQEFPADILVRRYGDVGDFLAVVGRPEDKVLVEATHAAMQGSDLRVEPLLAPPFLQGVDNSDHRNYWSAGFSALMVTDTAFFRNANYHEATDTPDTLDYERMELAVGRLLEAVMALTNLE